MLNNTDTTSAGNTFHTVTCSNPKNANARMGFPGQVASATTLDKNCALKTC